MFPVTHLIPFKIATCFTPRNLHDGNKLISVYEACKAEPATPYGIEKNNDENINAGEQIHHAIYKRFASMGEYAHDQWK